MAVQMEELVDLLRKKRRIARREPGLFILGLILTKCVH